MLARADRLLCCAMAYRTYDADLSARVEVPQTFECAEDAVGVMMDVLWFEANRSMQETIQPPQDAYMHAVDIHGDDPGIVTSRQDSRVHRRRLPLPRMSYEARTPPHAPRPVPRVTTNCVSFETAKKLATAYAQKTQKALTKAACRDMKADEKALQSLSNQQDKKRMRELETPEARQARLELARSKRLEKKQAKEAASATASPDASNLASAADGSAADPMKKEHLKNEETNNSALQTREHEGSVENGAQRGDATRADLADADVAGADVAGADVAGTEAAGADVAGTEAAGADVAGADVAGGEAAVGDGFSKRLDALSDGVAAHRYIESTEQENEDGESAQDGNAEHDGDNVESILRDDASAEKDAHALLPPRISLRKKKMQFYASPVPHDRHLSGLEVAGLHPGLEAAVLRASPSPNLRIIHGPPCTGKTRVLASIVAEFTQERVLICAPTNVGVANIYRRIVDHNPEAALLVPPSRRPPDIVVPSDSPYARVVCCTISSRAGFLLDRESFGVVVVDEAAQCMEAWLWCLLRPEVHTLVMAGDTRQLPALTSQDGKGLAHDRSMMERLLDLGYPHEFLSVQHRMHPEIALFPNTSFYDGRLTTSYALSDIEEPYNVVHVVGDCLQVGNSFCNALEVECCIQLQKKHAASGRKVVVISPYQAQTRALLARGASDVHTIDSFQGNEADVVILSIVRHADIGFWSDERRLNVALTRARHKLCIVGATHKWTGILGRLCSDARDRGLISSAPLNNQASEGLPGAGAC
jgi:uncharacterized protein YjbI with pentapeptide repeats